MIVARQSAYPSFKYDRYFSDLFFTAQPPYKYGIFCLEGFPRTGDSVSVTGCEPFPADSTGCRTRPNADFYRSESPARRRDVSGLLFCILDYYRRGGYVTVTCSPRL